MPYSSPAAQSSGAVAPVSWATAVKAGLDYLADPPFCRAYHNTTQTAATAVHQALALNSERFDTDTMHDTVTNNSRLTIKTAGVYHINGQIEWASNASGGVGVRQIEIRLNGATFLAVSSIPGMASVGQPQEIDTLYKFAVNDYIELCAFQNSGVTLTVNSSGNYSPEFAAHWIGNG